MKTNEVLENIKARRSVRAYFFMYGFPLKVSSYSNVP